MSRIWNLILRFYFENDFSGRFDFFGARVKKRRGDVCQGARSSRSEEASVGVDLERNCIVKCMREAARVSKCLLFSGE